MHTPQCSQWHYLQLPTYGSKISVHHQINGYRICSACVYINGILSMCAELLPSLWDAMDCSPSGSSVHGILQARILEWVAMLSSRGSHQPRDWACVSYVSCIGRQILYHYSHLRNPKWNTTQPQKRMGFLLFAETQMDLESIILSEMSEKDKYTFFFFRFHICYHSYVESKRYNKLMNITKKKQTHRYREQTSSLPVAGALQG